MQRCFETNTLSTDIFFNKGKFVQKTSPKTMLGTKFSLLLVVGFYACHFSNGVSAFSGIEPLTLSSANSRRIGALRSLGGFQHAKVTPKLQKLKLPPPSMAMKFDLGAALQNR